MPRAGSPETASSSLNNSGTERDAQTFIVKASPSAKSSSSVSCIALPAKTSPANFCICATLSLALMPLGSGLSMTVVTPPAPEAVPPKFRISTGPQTSSKLIGSQNPGGISGGGGAGVPGMRVGPSPSPMQPASSMAGRMKLRMRERLAVIVACMNWISGIYCEFDIRPCGRSSRRLSQQGWKSSRADWNRFPQAFRAAPNRP